MPSGPGKLITKRMRRWFIMPVLLILACLLAGCPVTQHRPPGDITRLREPLTKRSYHLYVPTWYTDELDWPVVITLHGSAWWDGPLRQAEEWGALADEKGFIVIAPKLTSAEGVLPVTRKGRMKQLVADDEAILAILDEVAGDYNIDLSSVMLSGFSAGGYPMWYTGLSHPDKFQVLVARACNSSIDIFEAIILTDRARQLNIYMFWGKDDLKPIQKQGWQAWQYLRTHGLFNTEMKENAGGHLRRPDIAYRFWARSLARRHRDKAASRGQAGR